MGPWAFPVFPDIQMPLSFAPHPPIPTFSTLWHYIFLEGEWGFESVMTSNDHLENSLKFSYQDFRNASFANAYFLGLKER